MKEVHRTDGDICISLVYCKGMLKVNKERTFMGKNLKGPRQLSL